MVGVRTVGMFGVLVLRRLTAARSLSAGRLTALRHSGTFYCGGKGAARSTGEGRTEGRSSRSWQQLESWSLQSRCLSTAAPAEEGSLIYTGNLSLAVRGVKMFSYSTSAASLILMPQILLKTGLGVQSLALQAAFCGIIGCFTFLTPIILHMVTKGYVLRLYHRADSDTYTAVTYSIFLTEKKTVFHQSQVRIPAVSRMFTTLYAGRMGLLVNPDTFNLPHDYNHLMGYDKPFSFSPEHLDSPSKEQRD